MLDPPPVADVQTHIEIDHDPRPSEIALRDYLRGLRSALTHAFSACCVKLTLVEVKLHGAMYRVAKPESPRFTAADYRPGFAPTALPLPALSQILPMRRRPANPFGPTRRLQRGTVASTDE